MNSFSSYTSIIALIGDGIVGGELDVNFLLLNIGM